MKNNNKGFVLVETLVVAVVVSAIFALVFKHFYPLMGEYEKRENYDDLDSKYGAYMIKRMIQDPDYQIGTLTNNYTYFLCGNFRTEQKKKMCREALVSLEVSCDVTNSNQLETCEEYNRLPHIYITRFQTTDFKRETNKGGFSTTNSEGLKDYVNSLPEFSHTGVNLYNANYRVIVEFYRHRFNNTSLSGVGVYEKEINDLITYSQIEVKKGA